MFCFSIDAVYCVENSGVIWRDRYFWTAYFDIKHKDVEHWREEWSMGLD